MSMLELYFLFNVLPSLATLFQVLLAITAILFLGVGFAYAGLIREDEEFKQSNLVSLGKSFSLFIFKIFPILILLCSLMCVFLPSEETIAKIYIANYVTNNKDIKQIPEVVLEYLKKEVKGD